MAGLCLWPKWWWREIEKKTGGGERGEREIILRSTERKTEKCAQNRGEWRDRYRSRITEAESPTKLRGKEVRTGKDSPADRERCAWMK